MTQTHSTPSQGTHGSGSQQFKPAQAGVITDMLRFHRGPGNATTIEELARRSGIGGRTIRSIISTLDGVRFLIGCTDDGRIYACQTKAEALLMTGRILGQVQTMEGRIQRRRGFISVLSDE